MAFYDSVWYCNFGNGTSTGYYAVTVRPQNTAVVAGVLHRQFTAPGVGSERVFVCIVAGTTANATDATWVTTRGAKTVDGTATWQECTGASAVNGDLTNTVNWTQAKAIGTPTLGAIIQRNTGASYWICSTAGTMGASEPAWPNNTAGTTQADGTTTWTCLGAVGNFTGGQAPHARLASVLTTNWFASGNTIYVGANHAETQAANMTMSPVSALMARILCHNQSGSYPPAASDLTTGAQIITTGNFGITFSAQGSFYFRGITFIAGSGAVSSFLIVIGASSVAQVQNWYYFERCSFRTAGTGVAYFQMGNAGNNWSVVTLNNTTVKFGGANQYLALAACQLLWWNTGQILESGSSVPAVLVQAQILPVMPTVVLEALDLSQLTGSLFATGGSGGCIGSLTIKDCKLNAAATVTQPANTGMAVQLSRSDSGATAYKSARYTYEGTETTETAITRVGGAIDPTGQAQSRKIVTTANAQWLRSFQAEPYAIWNATTGADITVTVCGTINAGAVPNNDDIWMEVCFLGSSSQPLGTIVTTTKISLFAANAAVASDSSMWNGGGSGAGWSPFKLTTTLSSPQPGMAGYIDVRVRAAKASTTWYIDPKIELT